MKKFSILLTFVLSLMLVLTACKKSMDHADSPDLDKARMELAKKTDQKTCPVMGEKINPTVYTDYKGKRIYFCCKGCIDKFKAEPEKYMKKLEGVKLEEVSDKG